MISEAGWILSNCHPYSTYSVRQACANSVDPVQTPQNAASDLGLLCLPLSSIHSQVVKGLVEEKFKVKSKGCGCEYLG